MVIFVFVLFLFNIFRIKREMQLQVVRMKSFEKVFSEKPKSGTNVTLKD